MSALTKGALVRAFTRLIMIVWSLRMMETYLRVHVRASQSSRRRIL